MNKFLTFQGQQPLYLGDVDFASEAIRDAFQLLLKGLTGNDGANAILSGVVGAERSSSVTFSAGVVSIDGEILPVEASSEPISGSLSDTFYLKINSSFGGSRTFGDGQTHACWETRTVEVTKEETDYPLSSFSRLQGGFGSQEFNYSLNGYDFRLVKTGAVWVVTLKRPAMTQLEDHFFEISIPVVQEVDLDGFPTVETMVPTTAYIDTGSGITTDTLAVKYYVDDGVIHIQMDLESGTASGTGYMQIVLPVS